MNQADRSPVAAPSDLIRGYSELVRTRVDAGWHPYLMTFMFRPLPGSPSAVIGQMHREVERVYATFAPRVVRRPCSPSAVGRLPILLAFADTPVMKNNMPCFRDVAVNNGLHMHGLLLVPPVSRLAVDAALHFKDNQTYYAPRHLPLDRIHIEPIKTAMDFVVDYAAKGLRSRRIDHDDGVLVLPRSTSEMR